MTSSVPRSLVVLVPLALFAFLMLGAQPDRPAAPDPAVQEAVQVTMETVKGVASIQFEVTGGSRWINDTLIYLKFDGRTKDGDRVEGEGSFVYGPYSTVVKGSSGKGSLAFEGEVESKREKFIVISGEGKLDSEGHGWMKRQVFRIDRMRIAR